MTQHNLGTAYSSLLTGDRATNLTQAITCYQEALRYLLARNMDIYVVQVLSQEEVEPELVGDLRLVDVEDDETAEITISAPLLKFVSCCTMYG